MPLGDFFRRRPAEAQTCPACGAQLPSGSTFCPVCGVRNDDPESQPLHIVDRTTGLFNDRFIRPVLEDELARAHRYGRALGILLIEAQEDGTNGQEPRHYEGRTPPQILAVLPDTDTAGTAHAANRVLAAVNGALTTNGRRAGVGLVCVRPNQRFRAGAIIEAATKSLRSGRPELLGR